MGNVTLDGDKPHELCNKDGLRDTGRRRDSAGQRYLDGLRYSSTLQYLDACDKPDEQIDLYGGRHDSDGRWQRCYSDSMRRRRNTKLGRKRMALADIGQILNCAVAGLVVLQILEV